MNNAQTNSITGSAEISNQNQKILVSIESQVGILNTKFEYMARDIKSLSDGMIENIANLKSSLVAEGLRISALEELNDKLDLVETIRMAKEDHQSLRDFKTIWKFVVVVASVIGAIIGFVLTLVYNFAKLGK